MDPPPFERAYSTTSQASSASGNSKRRLLTSKALDISSKVLSKSSQFLAVNKYDGLASTLARADQKVRLAREEREWGTWDHETANRGMQVGGSKPGSTYSRDRDEEPPPPPRTSGTGTGSYLSYFSQQNREKRARQTFTEEHMVCFPGYAALRSPSHARAGDIDVFLSGYCYRARPAGTAPTRSQRLLYGMAKRWTGLPNLPHDGSTGLVGIESIRDEDVDAALEEQALIDLEESSCGEESGNPEEAKARTLAALLEMGEHEEEEVKRKHESHGLRPYDRDPTQRTPHRQISEEPEELVELAAAAIDSQAKPRFRPISGPPPVSPRPASRPPSVTGTLPASRPASPTPLATLSSKKGRRPTALPPVLDATGAQARPASPRYSQSSRRSSFDGLDLKQLHINMKDRLQGFFGQKVEGRRVRVELFPVEEPSGSAAEDSLRHHSQPERPLFTRIITTRAGGAWNEKLTLPWQTVEAYLRVRSGRLDRSPDIGIRRLRVRAELVKEEGLLGAVEAVKSALEGEDPDTKKQREEQDSAWRTAVREVPVTPALGDVVHLVSDIDDTIKKTEVLGGLKTIFRNVFLWSYEDVVVQGMAEWYRAMAQQGSIIHYVSNSPWELWGPIERYLDIAGFPHGSVSLKEYSSMVTSMFESAGSRKRARVETIMKEFSTSKFICVGDSGEADLELYASLAVQYPGRILGIYIRDVTTLPTERRPPTPKGTPRSSLDHSANNSHRASVLSPLSPAAKDFAPKTPPLVPPKPSSLSRAGTSSSTRSTPPPLPGPAAADPGAPGKPAALQDPSADPLSPNNPMSGPSPEDTRKKALDAFWARVRKAEREVPEGTVVRLFRTGDECALEALRMVQGGGDLFE